MPDQRPLVIIGVVRGEPELDDSRCALPVRSEQVSGGEISARMDQNEISSRAYAKERFRCMESSALGNVICWMG